MDQAKIAFGGFVVPGYEASGVFQFVQAALDLVAHGIDCGIDGELDPAASLGRDHGEATTAFHILANEVSVIALVAEQYFWRRAVGIHDGQIAVGVRDLTAGQGERYGQVHRIDAEMDFGRKTTF